MDELNDRVDLLDTHVVALVAELHEERYWRRKAAMVFAGTLIVFALVLTGLGIVALGNRHTGQQIESCTTPAGKCHKEGRKQTTAAVEAINEHQKITAVFVGECILGGSTPLLPCVDRKLAQYESTTTTTTQP